MSQANSEKPKWSATEIARLIKRNEPTAEQIEIIEAPLQPMLVVAGAGSGKTETMAARVVYLVANGFVRADQVLGLTFTRKAAGELQDRVQGRLRELELALGTRNGGVGVGEKGAAKPEAAGGFGPLDQPTVATYNSFAAGVVSEFGLWAGIEPNSRLLSEASAWQMVESLVNSYGADLETDLTPATVTGHVLKLSGELAEHLRTPDELDDYLRQFNIYLAGLCGKSGRETSELLERSELRQRYLDLISQFSRRKQLDGYLTFSDQIALGADLATRVPQIGETYRSRYKVVLLDEYQDTSHAQVQLLSGLFGKGHPVTAVGDPNQAIYAWRGASASGLAHFPQDFPQANGTKAPVYSLATTWRNDKAVLAVANQVSQPLRDSTTLIEVPQLALSPLAAARAERGAPGEVTAEVTSTEAEEADSIAEWIAARWNDKELAAQLHGGAPEAQIEAAVLCRARKQFRPIAQALEQRGIPVEIVGLGGLLESPEVVDLMAMLHVVVDPSRGDWLLRLLRGPLVNLGIADIHALGSWAKELARTQAYSSRKNTESRGEGAVTEASEVADGVSFEKAEDVSTPTGPMIASDPVEQHSLVAALEQLPAPGVPTRDGRALSSSGHARLTALAARLEALRKQSHLTLVEVCLLAERALGLDVETMVAQRLGQGSGRRNLDAFRSVAADFSRNANRPTLATFLAWLDAAKERERGLDMPVTEIDKAAVQLITVHAAKGMEWDIVAVPGLVNENFPSTNYRHDNPLTSAGALPYELRGDRNDLPSFEWRRAESHRDMKAEMVKFSQDRDVYETSNERRLAYVAYTRAKHDLLLSGYWWGSQKAARKLSPFLTELLDAQLIDGSAWAEPPGPDEQNPTDGENELAMWPGELSGVQREISAAAELVRVAYSGKPQAPLPGQEQSALPTIAGLSLRQAADILLAERERAQAQEVEFPARVSTSALVRLSKDRHEFAQQLRRPIPAKPTVRAHRGTRFHDWVQNHLSPSGATFDFDDTEAAASDMGDEIELETLKSRFLSSEWGGRTPLSVEQEIHTQIGGVTVIARIDAVFDDPVIPGNHLIVDWKTGSPPREQGEKEAREVQLAIYRLAWSRYSGHPLERVSAAFHYVSEAKTIRPEKILSEIELEALIMGEI